MALIKGFGIDLGQHSVKLVELRKERGGLRLHRAKIVRTGATGGMSKDEKEKALVSALKKALSGVDIGQSPISIATPGLSAFIRYVKLPPVTPQRLKQIIGYEAQQQVPFPLNEVIWDYQVLDSGTEAETSVVLVAIKKDVLSDLIKSIKTCGIEPAFVDHRPLAVYNSIKYNYEPSGGVVVIIDVGEKTTDISVENEGQLCWTRSARIGSADITEAIRKKYGVSIEEAERIKEEQVVVLPTGADENAADEKTLDLWRAVKGPVSSIGAELQRTINYFQTQLGGTRADKIIITGGLSMMPNIDVLFGKIIGADVEKLDPLKKISAAEGLLGGIDAGANLSVALGLGLRALGHGFSRINLLPESIVSRQELTKKRAYLILSGVSIALMVGISWVFSVENYNFVRRNVEALQEDHDDYQNYNRLIREEQSEKTRIDEKIENVQNLVSKFWAWPDLLLEVARVVPEGVTVSNLRFAAPAVARETGRRRDPVEDYMFMDDPGMRRAPAAVHAPMDERKDMVLQFRGRADDFDKISDLIAAIESSPRFKSVDVVSAEPVTVSAEGERPRVQPAGRIPAERIPAERIPEVRETREETYVDFIVNVEVEGDFP